MIIDWIVTIVSFILGVVRFLGIFLNDDFNERIESLISCISYLLVASIIFFQVIR